MPPKKRLAHRDYTIGWISALPLEMAAAKAMLDETHGSLPTPDSDHNTYHLGEIGHHRIAIACLPAGVYGITSAAVVASQMLATFPCIKFGLLVGVGGGVPNETTDIRLGDVVVSKPTDKCPGVVQYDYGKSLANGVFQRTGMLNNPPQLLLRAVSNMQADHMLAPSRLFAHLAKASKAYPLLRPSFTYPISMRDVLFEPSCQHDEQSSSCGSCDASRQAVRPPRQSNVPQVFYGPIASANQVMKDAEIRDKLAEELGILCFEMEAAGLMNHFPCLVIRGICDYADSHKNKRWQAYAAATAAAYAKELLRTSIHSNMAPQGLVTEAKIQSKIPVLKATFLGRKQELQKLRQLLDPEASSRMSVVVWGSSAHGKTQLALHYLTLEKAKYDSVMWIDGSSPTMLNDSFEDVASLLPPSWCPTLPSPDRVLRWLEQDTNRSWLMVFDGIQTIYTERESGDSELDIRRFIPTCDHGNVLFTTTASDLHLRLGFPSVHLGGVDDQTGSSILLMSAGSYEPESSVREVAMKISRKLLGVPLALEQAGSLLSYGLISITDYNSEFQARYLDATLKTPTRKYVGSYEKGRTLWTVFDMLYTALGQRNPSAVKLLDLASFLGTGQVHFALLPGQSESGHVDISQDPCLGLMPWLTDLFIPELGYLSVIRELEASGLLRFGRSSSDTVIETFWIHGLVRYFIRSQVSEEDAQKYIVAALVLNGRPGPHRGETDDAMFARRHLGRLERIVEEFLSAIPLPGIQAPDGQYFRSVGPVAPLYAKVCRFKGNLQRAKHMWEIALQYHFLISEGQTWPRHASGLEELLEAADIDMKLGDLGDAREKCSLVLDRCEALGLDNDEIVVRAAAYLRQAREIHERRETNFERAVAAQNSTKAVHRDRDMMQELNDQEWTLQARYEEAASLLGSNDSETVQHAERLASYYRQRENWDEEEQRKERAWKSQALHAGQSHPDTVSALHALCTYYHKKGKLQEKIRGELYMAPVWAGTCRAFETLDLLLKAEEPDILWTMKNKPWYISEAHLRRYDSAVILCWASRMQNGPTRNMLFGYLSGKIYYDQSTLFRILALPESGPAIKFLLASGVKPFNIRDGYSALQHAAASGNLGAVRALLSAGADVLHWDINGITALHAASNTYNGPVVRTLLDHGAEVSRRTKDAQTPLHFAVNAGGESVVRILLEYGADLSIADNQNKRPLDCAIHTNNEPMVRLLLEYGGDITHQDRDGRTPLHYAVIEGHERIARILVEHGAEVSCTDNKGWTALYHAIVVDNETLVRYLVEKGAKVSHTSRSDQAPLHVAAYNERIKMIKVLLDFNASLEAQDNRGNTPLHAAVESNSKEAVELLLKARSDIFIANRAGHTVIQLAYDKNNIEICQLVSAHSMGVRDALGQTWLHHLVDSDAPEEFIASIAGLSHADPDFIDATDLNGRTALYRAAEVGNEFAVRVLLENAADCQITDNVGRTALDIALKQRMKSRATFSKHAPRFKSIVALLQQSGQSK